MEFAVQDTGCGIPEAKRQFIFEPFGHAESYKTRRHQGAGLGLTICTRLVKLMDGCIWLDSKLDKGSTFYFEVPLAASYAG